MVLRNDETRWNAWRARRARAGCLEAVHASSEVQVRAPGQRVKGASPTPEGDSLLELGGPKDGQNLQT